MLKYRPVKGGESSSSRARWLTKAVKLAYTTYNEASFGICFQGRRVGGCL